MSKEIQIFKNDEFGQVRGILINDEPYFIGKEVAEVLGYANSKDAIQKHVDEEDKQIIQRSQFATLEIPNRGLTIINESGLYSLILSSKLPNAKKFKRWVTSEVLPQIRKTGGYVGNDDLFINTYLPFADDSTKKLFKGTLETVRKQNEIIALQNETIKTQKEDIEHKEDVIVGLVDEISLAEKRQILNRVVRYKGANYRERWKELYKQFEMKYHISSLKQKMLNYNETHKPKMKSVVDYVDKVMNKIPELYEIACKLYENDVKELAKDLYMIA